MGWVAANNNVMNDRLPPKIVKSKVVDRIIDKYATSMSSDIKGNVYTFGISLAHVSGLAPSRFRKFYIKLCT
eukprot:6458727-Amphidinium_carterae.1